jgi:hypothetical protein
MMRVEATGVAAASLIEREMVLWAAMKALLDTALRSLGAGEAQPLLEASRQMGATADEMAALTVQLGRLPRSAEAQDERRRMLTEIGQQRSLGRALLRRWRRSLVLRQQLLGMQAEPELYTDSLRASREIR